LGQTFGIVQALISLALCFVRNLPLRDGLRTEIHRGYALDSKLLCLHFEQPAFSGFKAGETISCVYARNV
jgi:hypothetical protein